ncbi:MULTISPECIES: hypothetical protein [unclassified Mameliella]|uniref:hypothetical protein n=1 Tax=Mameliella sp. LZ-28 TaxID=2484146 RepID=UPI00143F0EE0|nr:hypothetical protein [Mameliella sp. LZ-28]MCR9274401.1 hypothetical protein [Paracoccaceae bacterium]
MAVSLTMSDQPALLQWAAGRVSDDPGTWPPAACALGVVDAETGEVLAVMVSIETYDGIIDVHFASNGSGRWARPNVFGGLFGYLFLVRRAFRVQGIIPVDAPPAHISMMLRLGFRAEGTLASGVAPLKDGIMFGMSIQDCAWIEESDKEESHGEVR